MNEINEFFALVANIGVLGGLVFLGIEVQQNSNLMRAEIRQGVTENSNTTNSAIAESLEVADIVIRAAIGDVEPGPTGEWMVFRSVAAISFRNAENELYLFEQGLYNEEEYRARLQTIRRNMETPGFRSAWDELGNMHSQKFQDVIEQLILEVGEIEA